MSAQLNPIDTVNRLADRAVGSADHAIEATRRATDQALDSVQQGVHSAHARGTTAFAQAAQRLEERTRQGMELARAASQQLRDQASRAGDRTVGYIQERPIPSMLYAAAFGVALAALAGWMSGSRRDAR